MPETWRLVESASVTDIYNGERFVARVPEREDAERIVRALEAVDDLMSCECVHALRDHSKRGRKPCLICDDCTVFLWSGNYYRPAAAAPTPSLDTSLSDAEAAEGGAVDLARIRALDRHLAHGGSEPDDDLPY